MCCRNRGRERTETEEKFLRCVRNGSASSFSPPSSRPDSWKFRRKQQTRKIPHVKIKTHKFGVIIECADAFRRLLRSGGGALDLCHLILLTPRMICKRRTSYLTKCSQILTQSLLETLAFGFFLSFLPPGKFIFSLSTPLSLNVSNGSSKPEPARRSSTVQRPGVVFDVVRFQLPPTPP